MVVQQLPEVVRVALLRADHPADRHEVLPNEGGYVPLPEGARVVHRLDLSADIPPAHMRDPVLDLDSLPRRGEQHVVDLVASVLLPQHGSVAAHLIVVLRRSPPRFVLDRDNVPTVIALQEDHHVHIVQLPLLQRDRHHLEYAIGFAESVVGIAGMGRYRRKPGSPTSLTSSSSRFISSVASRSIVEVGRVPPRPRGLLFFSVPDPGPESYRSANRPGYAQIDSTLSREAPFAVPP